MVSVWVNEKTCPICSDPLTVSGGVSIEYTWSLVALRSKRKVPASSQRAPHFSSSPARVGLSGTALDMIPLPYWRAAPARHRIGRHHPARSSPTRAGVDVRVRSHGVRRAPPRSRALQRGVGRPAPLSDLVGSRRALTCRTSPISTTRSSPGPRRRDASAEAVAGRVRAGVVGHHGPPRGRGTRPTRRTPPPTWIA